MAETTLVIAGRHYAIRCRDGEEAHLGHLATLIEDKARVAQQTTPGLTEQAIAHCLEQGLLRRHAQRVMQKLDEARSRSVRLAEAHGCEFKATPRGLFGWLDVGVDSERLARVMLEDGWLLAPGSLFHATPRATSLMRINFASTQDARFWKALKAARLRL